MEIYLRKYYKQFSTLRGAFDDYCKQRNRDCSICFFGYVAAQEYNSDKRQVKFCKQYIQDNPKEALRILDIVPAMS